MDVVVAVVAFSIFVAGGLALIEAAQKADSTLGIVAAIAVLVTYIFVYTSPVGSLRAAGVDGWGPLLGAGACSLALAFGLYLTLSRTGTIARLARLLDRLP